MDDISDDEVRVLFEAHKKERAELRIIARREFVEVYLQDMSFIDRRKMIRAWQDNYFKRVNAVFKEILNKPIRVSVHNDATQE